MISLVKILQEIEIKPDLTPKIGKKYWIDSGGSRVYHVIIRNILNPDSPYERWICFDYLNNNGSLVISQATWWNLLNRNAVSITKPSQEDLYEIEIKPVTTQQIIDLYDEIWNDTKHRGAEKSNQVFLNNGYRPSRHHELEAWLITLDGSKLLKLYKDLLKLKKRLKNRKNPYSFSV